MDDCIEWTGRIDRRGYGREGAKLAHRAAWERIHGPIPDGLTIDHLCFNPPCVHVGHMRLLTRVENAQNQRKAFKTHCVNGHEYTPENTYPRPATCGGKRDCRACIRERAARYKSRKAA